MNLRNTIIEWKGNRAEDLCFKFIKSVSNNKEIQEIWINVLYNRLLFKIGKISSNTYKKRVYKLIEKEKCLKDEQHEGGRT